MKIHQLKKIKETSGADFPAGKLNINKDFNDPNHSLPVEYTVTGELLASIQIGASIKMLRHSRNGVRAVGVFQSSPVTKIEKKDGYQLIHTVNSIYEHTVL